MSFQYGCCYCCCPKRFALLMLSLLCTIIILTEQAVAYVVQPPTATASLSHIPLNESLVEILPRANTSNSSIELLAASGQERSLNRLLMNSLTPGQQVINAVPYNERNDFIMHQLAVALERSYDQRTRQRYFKDLDDLKQYYGGKITNLENLHVYENFPTDLLQWVKQEFNVTHQHVYVQLCSRTEIWCTAQGVCYAYGSGIGCYCCPF